MKKTQRYFSAIAMLFLFALPVQAAETITYYHTDPVGTPLAMSNASGVKVWEADYKPFGEENTVGGAQANNRRFVGKEKDAETGLDYFGARYMATEAGRFLAPDPVRAVDGFSGRINSSLLANPQRLNGYAYSLNNPYSYIDDDGRFAVRALKRFGRFHYQISMKKSIWGDLFIKKVPYVGPLATAAGQAVDLTGGESVSWEGSLTTGLHSLTHEVSVDALFEKAIAGSEFGNEFKRLKAGTGTKSDLAAVLGLWSGLKEWKEMNYPGNMIQQANDNTKGTVSGFLGKTKLYRDMTKNFKAADKL